MWIHDDSFHHRDAEAADKREGQKVGRSEGKQTPTLAATPSRRGFLGCHSRAKRESTRATNDERRPVHHEGHRGHEGNPWPHAETRRRREDPHLSLRATARQSLRATSDEGRVPSDDTETTKGTEDTKGNRWTRAETQGLSWVSFPRKRESRLLQHEAMEPLMNADVRRFDSVIASDSAAIPLGHSRGSGNPSSS